MSSKKLFLASLISMFFGGVSGTSEAYPGDPKCDTTYPTLCLYAPYLATFSEVSSTSAKLGWFPYTFVEVLVPDRLELTVGARTTELDKSDVNVHITGLLPASNNSVKLCAVYPGPYGKYCFEGLVQTNPSQQPPPPPPPPPPPVDVPDRPLVSISKNPGSSTTATVTITCGKGTFKLLSDRTTPSGTVYRNYGFPQIDETKQACQANETLKLGVTLMEPGRHKIVVRAFNKSGNGSIDAAPVFVDMPRPVLPPTEVTAKLDRNTNSFIEIFYYASANAKEFVLRRNPPLPQGTIRLGSRAHGELGRWRDLLGPTTDLNTSYNYSVCAVDDTGDDKFCSLAVYTPPRSAEPAFNFQAVATDTGTVKIHFETRDNGMMYHNARLYRIGQFEGEDGFSFPIGQAADWEDIYEIYPPTQITYRVCTAEKSTLLPNCVQQTVDVKQVVANKKLQRNTDYWLNTAERKAGLYYNAPSGTCPAGESTDIPTQCRFISVKNLAYGVHYMLNLDERWPGIYYAEIAGKCPYGGVQGGGHCNAVILRY